MAADQPVDQATARPAAAMRGVDGEIENLALVGRGEAVQQESDDGLVQFRDEAFFGTAAGQDLVVGVLGPSGGLRAEALDFDDRGFVGGRSGADGSMIRGSARG